MEDKSSVCISCQAAKTCFSLSGTDFRCLIWFGSGGLCLAIFRRVHSSTGGGMGLEQSLGHLVPEKEGCSSTADVTLMPR